MQQPMHPQQEHDRTAMGGFAQPPLQQQPLPSAHASLLTPPRALPGSLHRMPLAQQIAAVEEALQRAEGQAERNRQQHEQFGLHLQQQQQPPPQQQQPQPPLLLVDGADALYTFPPRPEDDLEEDAGGYQKKARYHAPPHPQTFYPTAPAAAAYLHADVRMQQPHAQPLFPHPMPAAAAYVAPLHTSQQSHHQLQPQQEMQQLPLQQQQQLLPQILPHQLQQQQLWQEQHAFIDRWQEYAAHTAAAAAAPLSSNPFHAPSVVAPVVAAFDPDSLFAAENEGKVPKAAAVADNDDGEDDADDVGEEFPTDDPIKDASVVRTHRHTPAEQAVVHAAVAAPPAFGDAVASYLSSSEPTASSSGFGRNANFERMRDCDYAFNEDDGGDGEEGALADGTGSSSAGGGASGTGSSSSGAAGAGFAAVGDPLDDLSTQTSISRQFLKNFNEMGLLRMWAEQFAEGKLNEQAVRLRLLWVTSQLRQAERDQFLEGLKALTLTPIVADPCTTPLPAAALTNPAAAAAAGTGPSDPSRRRRSISRTATPSANNSPCMSVDASKEHTPMSRSRSNVDKSAMGDPTATVTAAASPATGAGAAGEVSSLASPSPSASRRSTGLKSTASLAVPSFSSLLPSRPPTVAHLPPVSPAPAPLMISSSEAVEDGLDGVARLTYQIVFPPSASSKASASSSSSSPASSSRKKSAGGKRKKKSASCSASTSGSHTPTAEASLGSGAAAAAGVTSSPRTAPLTSSAAAAASKAAAAMDAAAAAAASSSAASSVKEDEPKATARVQINHAWERLTGYSQTEMVERLRREHATCALMRFLFRSDFASAIHKISLVAAMERLSHGQHYVVVRTKSGEELYCLTSFHVLFTSTGVFQGMVHTLMPLPSSTPVPPFVPGVDQTEAALVYGNFTPKHRQIDWKAKLLMQQ